MHPALWKLYRLYARAKLRRMLRGVKTVRGAAVACFVLLMFSFLIVPSVVQAFGVERADATMVRANLSLVLLAICLLNLITSSAEKAIVFTMPEVEFLFPGPFNRRELLVFKLLSVASGAAFMALLFATIFLKWAALWIAAFVGIYLTLMFIQLLNMTLALAVQWLGEMSYNRIRRLSLLTIVGLAAWALWQTTIAGATDYVAVLSGFRDSWAGQIVLAPFDVFSWTITSQSIWPELLGWALLAVCIDVLLVTAVLRLDANFLEAAVIASQKRYEAIQRAKGGGMMTVGRRFTSRWRVPSFPWLGGAGPVARRQTIHLLRGSLRFLMILGLVAVGVLPALFATSGPERHLFPTVIGLLAWLNFFMVSTMPFGFRGDLDHMEWLKIVPLKPLAIVVGEIAPVILLLSALDVTVLGALYGLEESSRLAASIALVLTLPTVCMLVATESLLFLLFPCRMAVGQPMDLQSFGRKMILVLLSMLVFALCGGVAAGLGAIAYVLAGQSQFAFAVVTVAALALLSIALLLTVAWAFRRFDVSLDIPV